ncbi:hypothetical protein Tco_0026838 [Tanacetum coccineum]
MAFYGAVQHGQVLDNESPTSASLVIADFARVHTSPSTHQKRSCQQTLLILSAVEEATFLQGANVNTVKNTSFIHNKVTTSAFSTTEERVKTFRQYQWHVKTLRQKEYDALLKQLGTDRAFAKMDCWRLLKTFNGLETVSLLQLEMVSSVWDGLDTSFPTVSCRVGPSSDLDTGSCTRAREVMIFCTIKSKPLALPWGWTPRLDSGVRVSSTSISVTLVMARVGPLFGARSRDYRLNGAEFVGRIVLSGGDPADGSLSTSGIRVHEYKSDSEFMKDTQLKQLTPIGEIPWNSKMDA